MENDDTMDMLENCGTRFDNLEEKIDRNFAAINELLEETRKGNIALSNRNCNVNHQQFVSFADFDLEKIRMSNGFFIGYSRNEVRKYIERIAENENKPFHFVPKINTVSEFTWIVCNGGDGELKKVKDEHIRRKIQTEFLEEKVEDLLSISEMPVMGYLLIDIDGMTLDHDIITNIIDAMEGTYFEIVIGKGDTARSIKLDHPILRYYFIAESELFIPMELQKAVDFFYINKQLK